MQNKNLQMKRALRTALLVLLMNVAGMGKGYAQDYPINYEFSAQCSSGQILYYKIIDATNHYAEVVAPCIGDYNIPSWNGFTMPVGDLVLPENVEYDGSIYSMISIGVNAFGDCHGITSIIIPNSVREIGDAAFAACIGCTGSLIIPNSVTSIGRNAFNSCFGLSELILGNSVTSIGDGAFIACEGLSGDLVIPNSVTSIGWDAFYGCCGFTGNLVIPNSVTSIGEEAFYGCNGFTGNLIISSSLTKISHGVFSGCSGFSGPLIIPNSITYIGNDAFRECVGFTGPLVIPNSVDTIGTRAFRDCSGLSGTITLGNSVSFISSGAFNNCSGIETIIAMGSIPPRALSNSFDFGLNLIVRCGYKEVYEAWNWANGFSTIEEDCSPHNVVIDENNMSGGSISTSTNSTELGEEVQLTITPDEGMDLALLIVSNINNPEQIVPVYPLGKTSFLYGFIMPPFDVIIKATFASITSISENEEPFISIYPNPTNGQIKIEAQDLKHITISNLLGQCIYEGKASDNEFIYDFSKQGEGVYLIRIETSNGVVTKRVVVTR